MFLAADFFDALADETRRRMLALITHEGELCVCELHEALAVLQPKASRHLAILRDAQILSIRRDGTWIFYRVNPVLPDWAQQVLHSVSPMLQMTPEWEQDYRRLLNMANRPARCCP
jgi:ArsR family transcriptional regulator